MVDKSIDSGEANDEAVMLKSDLARILGKTHHRIKNHLQLICSLIDLRAGGAGTEGNAREELRHVGRQLRALASIYDLLGVDALGDLENARVSLKTLCDHIFPLFHSSLKLFSIKVDADDVLISERLATLLSLAFHELLSNCVKHGGGRATVVVRSTAEGMVIEVGDEGKGFPPGFALPRNAQRGLKLVSVMITSDLRGALLCTTHPDGGARVVIKVPSSQISTVAAEGSDVTPVPS